VKKKSKPRKENAALLTRRASRVLTILREEFPTARTALLHQDPFQLLVATILSAQCTDERVNRVTPGLFARYPTPQHLARVDVHELEGEIRSTGFFRMKAKSIIACSRAIVERFSGKVPHTMDELLSLPGVGRKTANVVLGQAFGISSGVVVDTHVHRISVRLGFSREKTPEKIENDLIKIFPEKDWIDVGSILILHGRKTCVARKPKCSLCTVGELCPSAKDFLT
jgi:endonuclease-3